MIFRRFVNHITSGRDPFASNTPVPSARDLAFRRMQMNRDALRRFLSHGAWTKEPDDAA